MPSTVGYLIIGQEVDSRVRDYNLMRDIQMMLSPHKDKSPDQIAKIIYESSGQLMAKYKVDMRDYYNCTAKAISVMSNSDMIITHLISSIEGTSNLLRAIIGKKGGTTK